MRAFAHDVFTYPLPAGHRFPLAKYRLVREAAERLDGIDVHGAEAASWEELGRTHSADWVDRVRKGRLERSETLALGLPWSPELVERSRRATGATIMAARAALEDGVAANLGGGTHHAFAHAGRGFCVFNDVVTALRDLRASGRVRRVLVVDVDVHQGDGTHALLAADAEAFTLSVNGFRNYPFRRVPGDHDVDLPDGTGDARYLDELARALPEALRRARPELCFVLAGADPYEGDRLGRLALTKAGLRARDLLIRDALATEGVPVCVTLAGGYAEDVHDTVEINVNTLRVFTRVSRRVRAEHT
jgi:acetoin utilization deacetylase AcuC-like enzyme